MTAEGNLTAVEVTGGEGTIRIAAGMIGGRILTALEGDTTIDMSAATIGEAEEIEMIIHVPETGIFLPNKMISREEAIESRMKLTTVEDGNLMPEKGKDQRLSCLKTLVCPGGSRISR